MVFHEQDQLAITGQNKSRQNFYVSNSKFITYYIQNDSAQKKHKLSNGCAANPMPRRIDPGGSEWVLPCEKCYLKISIQKHIIVTPCLTRFFHFFRTVLPWYEDKEIFSSMTDRLGKKDGMGRREVWPVADMWLVMSRPRKMPRNQWKTEFALSNAIRIELIQKTPFRCGV